MLSAALALAALPLAAQTADERLAGCAGCHGASGASSMTIAR